VTPKKVPEELALKRYGGEFGDTSKLLDCASEIVGASFIASFSILNLAF
jgi:hypothetical protein